MQHAIPERIVLRLHVKYELEEAAIIEKFFTLYGPKPADDFYSHLCAPNLSSKMHIVLDLHCKTVPTVNIHMIEHKVFKVYKSEELYVISSLETQTNQQVSHFTELDKAACEYARRYSHLLSWGTDRSYPEELDGDRLAQVEHSPGKFVS